MAWISKSSMPASSGVLPPTRSCLLSTPNNAFNWGSSIQMPETMVAISHSNRHSNCKQWWWPHISSQALVIVPTMGTQREQCFFCRLWEKETHCYWEPLNRLATASFSCVSSPRLYFPIPSTTMYIVHFIAGVIFGGFMVWGMEKELNPWLPSTG